MKWLRSLFKKKQKDNNSCEFGSFDINTGETYKGYLDSHNQMKYKRISPATPGVEIWSSPIYQSVLTIDWDEYHTYWFSDTKIFHQTQKVALYKQTNMITGFNRYFFDTSEHGRQYIDTNAFEKSNVVVFLN